MQFKPAYKRFHKLGVGYLHNFLVIIFLQLSPDSSSTHKKINSESLLARRVHRTRLTSYSLMCIETSPEEGRRNADIFRTVIPLPPPLTHSHTPLSLSHARALTHGRRHRVCALWVEDSCLQFACASYGIHVSFHF